MNKFIISILTLLFCTSAAYAQLFEKKDFCPNVKTVKGKYYNGSGGGGYWSLDKFDNTGRASEKESYRKKELLGRQSLIYNSNNDEVKGMYVGGRGSDDMYYEYKLDKLGRIKTLYHIIEKKRYKIATYEYYERE